MDRERPLASQLRELWARADAQEITAAAATAEQERLLDAYRQIWAQALLLRGEADLTHSILSELAQRRGTSDLDAVRRHCEEAVQSLKCAWQEEVRGAEPSDVERFYDRTGSSSTN